MTWAKRATDMVDATVSFGSVTICEDLSGRSSFSGSQVLLSVPVENVEMPNSPRA